MGKERFELKHYSIAAAVLSPSMGVSQAVYTDLEPDLFIDEPGSTIELDIDDDGSIDFLFWHFDISWSLFYDHPGRRIGIGVGAWGDSENGIIGKSVYYTGSSYSPSFVFPL